MPKAQTPETEKFTKATPENTNQVKPGSPEALNADHPGKDASFGMGAFDAGAGKSGSGSERAEQARADADKNLSDLFDKAFGKEEAPVEAAPEAQETPEAESEQSEQPATDVPADSSEDPRIKRARAALERSGFTSEEIDAMSEDTVLSRGLKRADTISHDEDAYRRLSELEKRLSEPESKTDSEPEKAEERPVEIRERLSSLIDTLGEEAVADVEAILTPMQTELAELRQLASEIRSERQSEGMGLMEQKRQELGERFPEFNDDQAFQRVVSRMTRLKDEPEYRPQAGEAKADAAARLMEDAARSLRMKESVPASPEAKAVNRETALKKKAGTLPVSGHTSTSPSKPMSHEQRSDVVLNALLDGKSEDQARQMAWGS